METELGIILQAAKDLGAPGAAVLSLMVIAVWFAKRIIDLQSGFAKNKTEMATSLIKIYEELNNTEPPEPDPHFVALRENIFHEFGLHDPELCECPPEARQTGLSFVLHKQFLYSLIGSAAGLTLSGILSLIEDRSVISKMMNDISFLFGVLGVWVILSVVSAFIVHVVFGEQSRDRTYLYAGGLTAVAVLSLITISVHAFAEH
jgi:hypothetical protein